MAISGARLPAIAAITELSGQTLTESIAILRLAEEITDALLGKTPSQSGKAETDQKDNGLIAHQDHLLKSALATLRMTRNLLETLHSELPQK